MTSRTRTVAEPAAQTVMEAKGGGGGGGEGGREASSAAATGRTHLEGLNGRRRRGVELGHLPPLMTPPAEQRDIVDGIREGLVGDLAEIAEQTEGRRTEGPPLQKQAVARLTDLDTAGQKLARAAPARRALCRALGGLT